MYNFSLPTTLKSWVDHIARAVGQGQRVAAETSEGCSESVEIPADASVEQRQFVHFKRSKAAGDRALSVGNDRLIKAGVGQPRAGDGQHGSPPSRAQRKDHRAIA